jgi:hypothetical protein
MVMADAQYNLQSSRSEGYLGNTLIAMFAEGGNFRSDGVLPTRRFKTHRPFMTCCERPTRSAVPGAHECRAERPQQSAVSGQPISGRGHLLVRCNPVTGTCRDQPLGTPHQHHAGAQPTPPGPTATPEGGECPINLRVSQQPPTINAQKIAPAYPIVVGQDPNKRGVDVSASIQTHPAIVKFDVPKYEHECQYVGGAVLDSACQNNPGWKNKKVFVGCETRTLTYPDPIAFAVIDADLAPESIRWITTDLAAKYPGAHVYQAHWALWPGRAPSQGGLSGDQTNLSLRYDQLPLADPGSYTLRIQGRTTGTPFTPPQRFSFTAPPSTSAGVDDHQVGAHGSNPANGSRRQHLRDQRWTARPVFAADHAALLIGLLGVLIIAGVYDRWLAGLANTRPDRAGQSAPHQRVARPYLRTLITGALWLLAASYRRPCRVGRRCGSRRSWSCCGCRSNAAGWPASRTSCSATRARC